MSLLTRLCHAPFGRTRSARQPIRKARCRLSVEYLEDRTVPSTLFEGTASAVFGSPTPPGQVVSGVGSNELHLGTPVPGSYDNLFRINPVSFSALDGAAFKVGDLTYRNGTTSSGTTADNPVLPVDVTLVFSTPSGIAAATFPFEFSLDITYNTTGNPVLDADILTPIVAQSGESFTSGGIAFTLSLIGFSNDNGDTIIEEFVLPENQTVASQLYAKIVPLPTLALTASGAEKSEGTGGGNTPFTFTVTRTGDTSDVATVDYAVTGSGANPATAADFAAVTGTVNFSAGQSSKTITINVGADAVIEVNEGFTVTLSDPSEGAVIITDTATGVIQNDDSATLTLSNASVAEGNSGPTTLNFPVMLSHAVDVNVLVDYQTQNGTATTADNDYAGVATATLTIPAGAVSAMLPVTVNGDGKVEIDETLQVAIINIRASGREAFINQGDSVVANGNFTAGEADFLSDYASSSTLDADGTYAVATNPQSLHADFASYGDHTSGTGSMMVVNGADGPGAVVWRQTVDVTPNTDYDFAAYLSSAQADNPARLNFVVDGAVIGALNGIATTGVWKHFFATWNSGAATSATLEIVNDNTVAGGNGFALDDIFFGPATFSKTVATGTITNDDVSAVSVAVSPGSVMEDGSSSLIYTFTRANTTSVAPELTAGFHVGGTASFASDYSADGADIFTDNAGRVTFAEGSATATVTILPAADATVEANETVILTMASGPGYTIGSPNTATGTIANDDTAVFTISDETVDESTGTLTFTVSLSNPVDIPVTVNVTYVDDSTDGGDFDHAPALVTFAALDTESKIVTVAITADSTVEATETFTAILSTTTALGGRGADFTDTGTGTILDNTVVPPGEGEKPDDTLATKTHNELEDAYVDPGDGSDAESVDSVSTDSSSVSSESDATELTAGLVDEVFELYETWEESGV